MIDSYREGYEAYIHHIRKSDNPYEVGAANWENARDWNLGYSYAVADGWTYDPEFDWYRLRYRARLDVVLSFERSSNTWELWIDGKYHYPDTPIDEMNLMKAAVWANKIIKLRSS